MTQPPKNPFDTTAHGDSFGDSSHRSDSSHSGIDPAQAHSLPASGHSRVMHTVVGSPLGPLTLVATRREATLCGVYMHEQRHHPPAATLGENVQGSRARAVFGLVLDEFAEYFAGERTEFTVPTCCDGTDFQKAVWAQLALIPYGETRSYAHIAERIGNPKASRAVGLANGRNPLSIIVPCHRVVGASGSLTGYGGGTERKRFLIDLEKQNATRAA